ncbi:hypothetical protein NEIFLAOT_00891 [Neisseria flavescens NRL30031/H210]|uniref:Uncharacterized protein n=1 Tax=Neisseria flavescens NRL30031/H210 TaxID=546264 RepID=C0ELS9_NEIFL|nr:hypothetical protein NEIFLAOT_00891 [Neisseria flavescens NRL30031/H210]
MAWSCRLSVVSTGLADLLIKINHAFLVRMNCTDRKGRLKTNFQTA